MSSIERNAIKNMAYLDETPLVVRLPRADIRPDPDQPRKTRNQEKLEGLAQTMLVKQLQPILVRQVDGETPYMIVIGEGRWLGAGINEEKTGQEQYLDCILVDETNAGKIRSMQLIENLQREDMNELEIANGYRELIELGECKNGKEVADRMGVSPATVSVFLKVLDAPEPVKELVAKGITKIDTARTLMMLAEINKERADALVHDAMESGVLKRSSVRDAYAEEKTRAENAAAAAEAATEAAQHAQDNAVTNSDGERQDAAQLEAQAASQSELDTAPQQPAAPVVQQQEAAPVAQAPEAHQKPAGAAQVAPATAGKADPEKTPQKASERNAQPEASAAGADVRFGGDPLSQDDKDVLQEATDTVAAQPESPMLVAEKFDVLVSIRSGSVDEERFIGLDGEYGNARLASHIVHRDSTRAWVQFGTAERDYTSAFKCGDLEIVKIVQRG